MQRPQEQCRPYRLGADVGDGRADQPEPARVDEQRAQHGGQPVRDQDDHDRFTGALNPAHPPVARQDEQHTGHPHDRDAKPGFGRRLHRATPAREQSGQRAGEQLADRDHADADPDREPGRLHPFAHRVRSATGPEPAGGPRSRPVFDERAEDREHGHQRRPHPEPGQRARAQMTDHSGIDEQVQRLGGQDGEGRHGQREQPTGRGHRLPRWQQSSPLLSQRTPTDVTSLSSQVPPTRTGVTFKDWAVGTPCRPFVTL